MTVVLVFSALQAEHLPALPRLERAEFMQRLTEAPRVFNLEGDLTPQRLRENYSLVQLREMSVQYRFGILWAEAAYADGSLSLNDLRKMQKSAAEKQILIALVIAEKKQKR